MIHPEGFMCHCDPLDDGPCEGSAFADDPRQADLRPVSTPTEKGGAKKLRKIPAFGPKWQGLANRMARGRVLIVVCSLCSYPRFDGYICGWCGDDDSGVR